MNSPDERGRPHLWGHVQEAVLADASVVLGRKDLRALAVSSAEAVLRRSSSVVSTSHTSTATTCSRRCLSWTGLRRSRAKRGMESWRGRPGAGLTAVTPPAPRFMTELSVTSLTGSTTATSTIVQGLKRTSRRALRCWTIRWCFPRRERGRAPGRRRPFERHPVPIQALKPTASRQSPKVPICTGRLEL